MRIPQLRRTPLKLTRRGYVRQLASLTDGGSVQKPYLGLDPAIAAQRRQWIEAVYVENCRVFNSLLWTDTFLNLAKQLARLGSVNVWFGERQGSWAILISSPPAALRLRGRVDPQDGLFPIPNRSVSAD